MLRFRSKLERRIVRRAGAAVGDHGLIQPQDRILVAVSGGKDSLSMLEVLRLLQVRSPVPFELHCITLVDPSADPAQRRWLDQHLGGTGVPFQIEESPIAEVVKEKVDPKDSPCGLCSRLRRGILYSKAKELACSKIALGHHLDDLIETLLMNLFFSGQLRSMPARLVSDDRRNVVIRPLCYVPEQWLREYARERRFKAATCEFSGCRGNHGQRQEMKQLVEELAERHPQLRYQALRAMQNVKVGHLLDPRWLSSRGRVETQEEE